MMTPAIFAADFIKRWEDGNSTDPNKTHSMERKDNGNWSGGKAGVGVLIGSNHGVTPAALALHRGVPVRAITVAVMHALTASEAGDIALGGYFVENRLDRLPWNAITASVFDFGWGAGKFRTVEKLQSLIGVDADGKIGPATIAAYQRWLTTRPIEKLAVVWAQLRNAYYDAVIHNNPDNEKFRHGWYNRTAYFTPGHPEDWWHRFNS